MGLFSSDISLGTGISDLSLGLLLLSHGQFLFCRISTQLFLVDLILFVQLIEPLEDIHFSVTSSILQISLQRLNLILPTFEQTHQRVLLNFGLLGASLSIPQELLLISSIFRHARRDAR